MWQDKETVTKSLESYQKAFNEIFEICPRLQFRGSGTPVIGTLQGNIEPFYVDKEKIIKNATSFNTSEFSLFELGSPKHVGKSWSVWNYSFLTVRVIMSRQWTACEWEAAVADSPEYTDDDGVKHFFRKGRPATIKEYPNTLDLICEVANFGLQTMMKAPVKVKSLLDKAPEDIRDKYKEKCNASFKRIRQWQKAILAQAETAKEICGI